MIEGSQNCAGLLIYTIYSLSVMEEGASGRVLESQSNQNYFPDNAEMFFDFSLLFSQEWA